MDKMAAQAGAPVGSEADDFGDTVDVAAVALVPVSVKHQRGLGGGDGRLTAVEALRRGESLASVDPAGDASGWSVLRDDGVDEQQAAR